MLGFIGYNIFCAKGDFRHILKSWRFGRSVTAIAVLLFIALSAAFVVPIYHESYSAEAATGGAVSPVLTFASINPVASVNMIVSSPTGTFATSNENEKAAFTISTNNYTGYTLVLKSTGNVTNLSDGNSHNISTISNSTTSDVFASDGASGQALNNRWGYIPNYYNATGTNPSVNTTTYYPAPTSTNTATLRTTDVANSANGIDNADDYTIGLGFRADYNSPSGTYTNDTFVLEFVANPVAFVIQYDKNTTDTVTSMPANQSGTSAQNHITLSSDTPTRAHYNFLGWCEGEITVTNNAITGAAKDTCTGTNNNIYQPGDNFYFDATASNNATLKAMWEERYYMQDFTTNMCNSMADSLSLVLYDRRDEQDYTIAKIDEECWMTKNLNLAGGTALYSATSNVPSGYDSVPYYTLTESTTTGFSDNNVAYLNNSNNTECVDGPCYSYYSYVNATVGVYNTTMTSGEMDYDICPKGWRLPSADNLRDLASVYSTAGDITAAPFMMDYTGRYNDNSFGYGVNVGSGKAGTIISSTISNSGWIYKMTVYGTDSDVNPGDVNVDLGETKVGNAVRCVLKYPYLQDQNHASMATLLPNTNDTMIFADKRDNAKYTVGKLADGNYWTMKNLALNLETVSLTTLKDNTNASDESLEYLKGVSTRNASTDPGGNYATSGVTTTWVNSYSDPMINTDNKNVLVTTYGPAAKDGKSKAGIYYNYCATSAGTYCFGDGTNAGTSVGNATEDICPKNWRLPTGGTYGEIWQMCSAVKGSDCVTDIDSNSVENMDASSPSSLQYQMSLAFSGGYLVGSTTILNSNGVIWSSTRRSDPNMFYIDYRDPLMYVNGGNHREWGVSVRCVLKYPTMQEQTPATLATLLPNNGDTTLLEDKRDSSRYEITKINGEYWMTDNLRITGTVIEKESNFTGGDFNVSAGDLTAGNSFTEARTHVGVDGDNKPTTWYNYCAVSAGTVCDDVTIENAYRDICPLGWRLPTGDEITDVVSYKTLFSPVIGGAWHGGSLTTTYGGNWWSSLGVNATNQLGLSYDGSAMSTVNFNKDRGRYTRCVAETRTTAGITYMQEVNKGVIRNTTEGATETLVDKRDNIQYEVTKINGDLWMIQNLRLAAGTTLTNAESNVDTSYTIPTTDSSSPAYSATADLTSGNSYTEGRTHTGVDDNSDPTMWYNYCAASAGSVCTDSDTINASQDVCPNGWHLPSGPGTAGGSDLNNLIGNDVSGWQDATVKFNSFGAIAGGFYRYGAITETENGNWWSGTPHSVENSYLLTYDGTNNRVLGYSHNNRTLGLYIRCVANNTR